MGKTTPPIAQLLHQEKNALAKFRRALRREDQRILDEVFTQVHPYMMAASYADHLLPLEIFLLAMLLEEHKLIKKLQREFSELKNQSPP